MTTTSFVATGVTKTISAGTSSARVQLAKATGDVRICNPSDTTIFIAFGGSTIDATTSDIPIPGNGFTEVQGVGGSYVAAITASGSTKAIYFTSGRGI